MMGAIVLIASMITGCCMEHKWNKATYKTPTICSRCKTVKGKSLEETAEELFQNGKYEKALEIYCKYGQNSDYSKEICKKIYKFGIKLFENKKYDMCEKYMDSFETRYEENYEYAYVARVLNSVKKKDKNLDYFGITVILNEYSENGFKPAKVALKKEPFINYVPLVKMEGVYRSEKDFFKEYTIGSILIDKYKLYSYINVGVGMYSTSFAKDADIDVTEERIKNRAKENLYDCKCIYVKKGLYHCDVEYTDSITGVNEYYSYDLYLKKNKIFVKSLETSESKNTVTFTDGIYFKIS